MGTHVRPARARRFAPQPARPASQASRLSRWRVPRPRRAARRGPRGRSSRRGSAPPPRATSRSSTMFSAIRRGASPPFRGRGASSTGLSGSGLGLLGRRRSAARPAAVSSSRLPRPRAPPSRPPAAAGARGRRAPPPGCAPRRPAPLPRARRRCARRRPRSRGTRSPLEGAPARLRSFSTASATARRCSATASGSRPSADAREVLALDGVPAQVHCAPQRSRRPIGRSRPAARRSRATS